MLVGVALGVWAAPGIVMWLAATTDLLPPSAVGPEQSLGDAILLAAIAWLAVGFFRTGKQLGNIR